MNLPGRAPKHLVLQALLQANATACVHFDPRKPGVELPSYLMRQSQVVLQVGYGKSVLIGEFQIDGEAFSGIFSFKGRPHFCRVPFTSVFAVFGENDKGVVWGQDVPPEVSAALAEAAKRNPVTVAPSVTQEPAEVLDARDRFDSARISAGITRSFYGPSQAAPAKVINLADRRKPRA